MKFYRRIWIREQGFPADLYNEIVQLRPGCREGDHFRLECQPGDQAAAALAIHIAKLCDQYGLKQSAGGDVGTLGYDVKIYYEPEDLEAARYLKVWPQKRMFRSRDKTQRDALGRLLLPAAQARPTIQTAWAENWLVVSDRVRKLVEAGQFLGIQFLETRLSGISIRAASEPFWEVTSNIKLPKMLNSIRNELSAGKFYVYVDAPYRNPQPEYQTEDIASIGPFDVARTFENLYGEPELVVSQRLYHYCIQHKIPLEVCPVSIAPT